VEFGTSESMKILWEEKKRRERRERERERKREK